MTKIVRALLGLPTLRAGPQFQNSKLVLVIEYWNLKFVCDLVLGVWDFIGSPSLHYLGIVLWKLTCISQERRNRVAHPAFLSPFQTLDDLFHPVCRDGKSHLVILGLGKNTVTKARENNLTLTRTLGNDDLFGAINPPPET